MKNIIVGLFFIFLIAGAAAQSVDINGVIAPDCDNGPITSLCFCGTQTYSSGLCCSETHLNSVVCTSDSQCNDSNSSTTDTCVNPDSCSAACNNVPIACNAEQIWCSSACVVPLCISDAECDDGNPSTTDACLQPYTCGAVCSNIVADLCGNGSIDAGENCSTCPADYGSCSSGLVCVAGECVAETTTQSGQGNSGGGGGGSSSGGGDPAKSGLIKLSSSAILVDEIITISSYCQWGPGCELRIDGNTVFELQRSGGFKDYKTEFSIAGTKTIELYHKAEPDKLVAIKKLSVKEAGEEMTGIGVTVIEKNGFELLYEKVIDFGSTQSIILKIPEGAEEGTWEIMVVAPDGSITDIESDSFGVAYVAAYIPGNYYFTAQHGNYVGRGLFTVRKPTVLNSIVPGGGETIEKYFGEEASVNIFYLSLLVIGWLIMLVISFRFASRVVGEGFLRKAVFAALFALIPIVANYAVAPVFIAGIISLQMFSMGLVEVLAKIKEKQEN